MRWWAFVLVFVHFLASCSYKDTFTTCWSSVSIQALMKIMFTIAFQSLCLDQDCLFTCVCMCMCGPSQTWLVLHDSRYFVKQLMGNVMSQQLIDIALKSLRTSCSQLIFQAHQLQSIMHHKLPPICRQRWGIIGDLSGPYSKKSGYLWNIWVRQSSLYTLQLHCVCGKSLHLLQEIGVYGMPRILGQLMF